MSIIFDNRSRIALRIRQLVSGTRHSQTPRSRLRRMISNVEILDRPDRPDRPNGPDVTVGANFVIYESRERGVNLWAGRYEYHLCRGEAGWQMAAKKVMLVDNDRPLPTLAFLI